MHPTQLTSKFVLAEIKPDDLDWIKNKYCPLPQSSQLRDQVAARINQWIKEGCFVQVFFRISRVFCGYATLNGALEIFTVKKNDAPEESTRGKKRYAYPINSCSIMWGWYKPKHPITYLNQKGIELKGCAGFGDLLFPATRREVMRAFALEPQIGYNEVSEIVAQNMPTRAIKVHIPRSNKKVDPDPRAFVVAKIEKEALCLLSNGACLLPTSKQLRKHIQKKVAEMMCQNQVINLIFGVSQAKAFVASARLATSNPKPLKIYSDDGLNKSYFYLVDVASIRWGWVPLASMPNPKEVNMNRVPNIESQYGHKLHPATAIEIMSRFNSNYDNICAQVESVLPEKRAASPSSEEELVEGIKAMTTDEKELFSNETLQEVLTNRKSLEPLPGKAMQDLRVALKEAQAIALHIHKLSC